MNETPTKHQEKTVLPDEIRNAIDAKLGEQIGSLPTLPDAVMKITELVNDPNSSMRQIESVMEVDPVLSSTVLKVVNSSFYGMAQEISALRLALVILGIKEIKNLVLSLSVFRLFPAGQSNGHFDIKQFWHHSATTGQIAKSLSQRFQLHFAGEEFVGGLIHDIGKIVLLKTLAEEYLEILEASKKERIPLHKIEWESFGFHHGHVGGWLGKHWHLPKKLIAAITFHDHPEDSEEFPHLVGVVSLASALAQAAGTHDDGMVEALFIEEHPAFQMLMENTMNLDSVDWERFTHELGTDVQKSVEFVSLSQENLWTK